MLWYRRLGLRLRSLFRKTSLEDSMRLEFEFHLEHLKAEFIAAGMGEADAEAAARREFGHAAVLAEQCRDHRRTRWLDDFVQDIRYAVRSFRRAPGFAAVAIGTLALGVGANTAFFSAAYAILYRPLPYPDSNRLVTNEDGVAGVGAIVAQRELSRTVDYAGYLWPVSMNLQLGNDATRTRTAVATANLLRVLEIRPALGRWFESANENEGMHRVAVLSDAFWRSRFGANPNIVGTLFRLDEESYEVIGVMPPGFAFPSPQIELWTPCRIDPRNAGAMWGRLGLTPIGRLKPGVAMTEAQQELKTVIDRVRKMYPWRMPDEYARSARVVRYGESLARDVQPKIVALSAASVFLLLIACGNVANLLLARAVSRDREFSMREALGARPSRLIRQLVAENLLLTLAGGTAGLLAATALMKSLPYLLPKDTPRLHEIAIDGGVVGAATLAMLATLILFSAAPLIRLWRTTRRSLGARGATAQRSHAFFSVALIGCELALATVLLLGAGLMARTLFQLSRVDAGVQTAGIVSAHFAAGPSLCPNVDRCQDQVNRLSNTLLQLPAVKAVNWSGSAPLERELAAFAASVEDHPKDPGAPAWVLWDAPVTPGYFRSLGIRLLSGRYFLDSDRAGTDEVVIISAATARRFWPAGNAVGKRIKPVWNEKWRTIVGVVSDVTQYSLNGFPEWIDGVEYRPLSQTLPRRPEALQLAALIESTQPGQTASALPAAIRAAHPGVVVSKIARLEDIRAESTVEEKSTATLLAVMAALGLTLGIAGVYSVISHRSAQRTKEIGIRMALGATRNSILNLVVRETALVALAGTAAGLAAGWSLTAYLRSLLFGVATHDAATFLACPIVLLLAALLASAIPASRASRLDPVSTLRQD